MEGFKICTEHLYNYFIWYNVLMISTIFILFIGTYFKYR